DRAAVEGDRAGFDALPGGDKETAVRLSAHPESGQAIGGGSQSDEEQHPQKRPCFPFHGISSGSRRRGKPPGNCALTFDTRREEPCLSPSPRVRFKIRATLFVARRRKS